eukprot:246969_1
MAIMTIMKTILDSTNNPTTRTNNKHNTQPNKCIKTQIIANVTNRNKEEIRESGTEEEEEEGVHTQTGEPTIEVTRQTHKEIRMITEDGITQGTEETTKETIEKEITEEATEEDTEEDTEETEEITRTTHREITITINKENKTVTIRTAHREDTITINKEESTIAINKEEEEIEEEEEEEDVTTHQDHQTTPIMINNPTTTQTSPIGWIRETRDTTIKNRILTAFSI